MNRKKQRQLFYLQLISMLIIACCYFYGTYNNSNIAASVNERIQHNKSSIKPSIEKRLKDSISKIYGSKNLNKIYNTVKQILVNTQNNRSANLKKQDSKRLSDWYKDEIIYMFYADQFGIQENKSTNTFKEAIKMLDYLKDLGITTIYILPFMDSPMGDGGFDIKNFKKIRKDLGSIEDFKLFVEEAHKRNMKIKADLVLNHFSDQHKWFKEALKGDSNRLNYFLYRTEKPEYKKIIDKKRGTVIEYKEKNGTISSRRLIFPDICENHFRKISINGKNYYFYHTFYPFQIDINWKNPEVLYEILNIIAFWSNIGIDIFRFDATAFLIKEPGTNAENLPKTLEIIKLLSTFLKATSPKSVIQGEVANNISKYFGKEETFPFNDNKSLLRTEKVQIAYDFPLMGSMWASLINGNKKYFWNNINKKAILPNTSSWGRFLRVHDELTLEAISPQVREEVYQKIIKKGKEFRKGLGISGRMANFLDNNSQRICLAFSILLSLPGTPIIYYGDEIGVQNNLLYADKTAKRREANQKINDKTMKVVSFYDSRDINRGPIQYNQFYDAMQNKSTKRENQIYHNVKKMINTRKDHKTLRRGKLLEIQSNTNSVISYLRETNQDKILILNNLNNKKINLRLTPDEKTLKELANNNYKNLLSETHIPIKTAKKQVIVNLKPYEYLWLKLEN